MLCKLIFILQVQIEWDFNEVHGTQLDKPALEMDVYILWQTPFQLH